MTVKDSELLQCPFCLAPFKVGSVWQRKGQEITFGTLYCACDEYPIVNGILYLFRPLNRSIIELLRKKMFAEATTLCFSQRRKFQIDQPWMKAVFASPLRKFFEPENLRRVGKESVIFVVGLFTPRHLLSYYFNRSRWQESLTLVFPLAVLLAKQSKKSRKKVNTSRQPLYWLDVGAGIVNYYDEMSGAWPGLKMVSCDSSFVNLFLSAAFFPGKKVVRVCADANFLHFVRPKKLDVVTFIDSLDSLSSTLQVVRQVVQKGWLKNTGLLFASSLAEHLYFEKSWGLFPLPRKLLLSALAGLAKPTFFDNRLLSQSLVSGSVHLSDVKISNKISAARYSMLWSEKLTIPKEVSSAFLPAQVRQNATLFWETTPPTWHNRAY